MTLGVTAAGVVLFTVAMALLRHLRSRARLRRNLQWAEEFVESIVGDDRNLEMPDGWRDAVRIWLEAKFPHGSAVDEIDELHAELAYWDYMVADVAIPLNEGRQVSVGAVDVLAGLRAFRAQIAQLSSEVSEDGRALLEEYRSYAELLEDLEVLVRQRLAWGTATIDQEAD